MQMTLTINGQDHSVEAPAATLLVEVLRDQLGPHRHPHWLRHQPVRRLQCVGGWRGGEGLHDAGCTSAGRAGHHNRRIGQH